jgi:hypothetical protein
MLRHRCAIAFVAAALGMFVAGPAIPAFADSGPNVVPTVTGTFEVTVPGIGLLSFGVDASGQVTNLVVAPSAGITAGAPITTEEGVQVPLTDASGAVHTVDVQIEREDGGVHVSAEVDTEEPEVEATDEPDVPEASPLETEPSEPTTTEPKDQNGQPEQASGDQQEHATTSTTEESHDPATPGSESTSDQGSSAGSA